MGAATLIVATLGVTKPTVNAAAAAGPFVCSPGFYQVTSGLLRQLDPVTGTYTTIGTRQPSYNAMGYDTLDNYLYAVNTAAGTPGDLLKIANDGSITNLGRPAALPAGPLVAADFDNAGNLIARSTATTWYSIHVATNVATTLTITGAADAGNDLVWSSGVAYLLNGTTLYSVNLSTHVATSATVSGIVSGSFGAGWSDSSNNLYFSDNNTGHIYLVNGYTTASPAGVLLVTGMVTANNDGAACKAAANPFELPVANADAYAATSNSTLSVAATGVLTNDVGAGISVTGSTPAINGTAVVQSDGSFVYTPTSGYSGSDSFTYTITDAFSRTSTATATFAVHPVAADVTATGTGPGPLVVTPTTPIGVGPFIFTLTSTPPGADGIAAMNPTTGQLTFTPAAGFSGPVPTFTYSATDAASDVSAPANIHLSIGMPAPPATQSLSGTTPANQLITLRPTTPTGAGPFTFAIATAPAASDGVASIDASTGAVTFTPAQDFSGVVPPFTYTVTDAYSQTSTPKDVSIDVTPLSKPAAGTGPAGAPITVQPPAPVGTAPFTYALVPGSLPPAADGTVSINRSSGTITFTPAPGFSGNVPVKYTVTDAAGLTSAPAIVTFDVNAASTTVPDTGAVEAPMLWGCLLIGVGLLMVALVEARRFRRR